MSTKRLTLSLVAAFFVLLLGATLAPQPLAQSTDSCTYDESCGAGMCKVWEHSRFVCEPKQYTVAVWARTCLDKLELSEKSSMEAPLNDDGTPDLTKSQLKHTRVVLAKNCQFRYEVRER